MSKKEQYASFERGPDKRQGFGFSGAADHRELMDWVDRELEQLFEEFLQSPWRLRPRKLTQKAAVRPGCDAVAGGSNAADDLSAE